MPGGKGKAGGEEACAVSGHEQGRLPGVWKYSKGDRQAVWELVQPLRTEIRLEDFEWEWLANW